MNDTNESPNPSKLMRRMIVVSALAIIVIGAVFYRSLAAIPFALGVMVTSGLNIIKLRMLERTVRKVINMDDQEAGKNVVRLQYLFRYFITGVVLVAVGFIYNYTTPPPFYSSRENYFGVWAALFPNAPEALLNSPLISIWGAIIGIFTMQLSVILVRSMKLEKDGDNFIKYDEDGEVINDSEDAGNAIANADDSNEDTNTAENGTVDIVNKKEIKRD